MRSDENIFSKIDWITVALYFVLVICGWFAIYGAVYEFDDTYFWDFNTKFGRQFVWIICAIAIGTVLLLLNNRVYDTFSYQIYILAIIVLIVTLVIATDTRGSRSWLKFGSISLQPAEFAKTATCLALAKYTSAFGFNIKNLASSWKAYLIILLPMLIIICQKETGTALAYLAMFLVLYRLGMTGIVLLLGVCAVVYFIVAIRYGEVPIISDLPDESFGIFLVVMFAICITLALIWFYLEDFEFIKWSALGVTAFMVVGYGLYKWLNLSVSFSLIALVCSGIMGIGMIVMFFKTRKFQYIFISLFLGGSIAFGNMADYAFNNILAHHQRERIKVTLGMEMDEKGSFYNVNQSMIAIGAGQITGKGFLNGTQNRYGFVPEKETDFIFCTVGEEHGFIGSFVVILLFVVLMLRLIYLAERQRSAFSRIYGYCVSSIFFFHLAINIGMVTGLTPVIGIPLPFFSYGGSSLWSFTILLFVFLRLDASRKEYMG